LLGATLPTQAFAQDGGDVGLMRDAMHTYFGGEKREGFAFLGLGVAALAGGVVLFTQGSPFFRGASYTVAGIGLLHAIVGTALLLRTDAQVAGFDQQLTLHPAAYFSEELTRMKGVNRTFDILKITELVLAAGGALTAGLAWQSNPTLAGIGAGLAVQALVTLGLDLFAEARADRYTEALVTYAPQQNAMVVGLGGRF
jgi:hypothetical protein